MSEERDFDYVMGKVPRKDKEGNDVTGDKLGKGGRRRPDGTYSAVVYDLEEVDENPRMLSGDFEKLDDDMESAYLGGVISQETMEGMKEVASDILAQFMLYGIEKFGNFIKRKYIRYKDRKQSSVKEDKKKKTKNISSVTFKNTITEDIPPSKSSEVLGEYTIDMTNEEAQKELIDAFIFRVLSERKIWNIKHANIIDSNGNITDGCDMIKKLGGQRLLNNINAIISHNPNLLESWQATELESIFERKLMENNRFVPISLNDIKNITYNK